MPARKRALSSRFASPANAGAAANVAEKMNIASLRQPKSLFIVEGFQILLEQRGSALARTGRERQRHSFADEVDPERRGRQKPASYFRTETGENAPAHGRTISSRPRSPREAVCKTNISSDERVALASRYCERRARARAICLVHVANAQRRCLRRAACLTLD